MLYFLAYNLLGGYFVVQVVFAHWGLLPSRCFLNMCHFWHLGCP